MEKSLLKKSGVIEGFYGIPWSFEQRKSIIESLSFLGLGRYIYAPKDDPYHNIKWRELYPEKELNDLKALVEIANEKEVDFVWAIHPGQNLISFEDYDNEIEKLYKKYDQLHQIGVKSFALCMDDIDRDLAYEDRNNHLKLVNDIIKFISNYENKRLLFVHPWYNGDWIDEKGQEYFDIFSEVENLDIMWTGYNVVVPITNKSNDYFKSLTSKDPDIWFNWPVNDYRRSEIYMEVFEYYDSRDINFNSIYLNPMNQAELSKLSIYQVRDYLENPQIYDPAKSFKNALSYLDEAVAEDLKLISDSFYGSDVYLRKDEKKFLAENEIKTAYEAKDYEKLSALVNGKIKALDNYFNNYTNKSLYDEVKPFFEGLHLVLKAINALLEEDKEKGQEYFEKSKECQVKILKEFKNDEIVFRQVSVSETLIKIYEDLLGK